MFHSLSRPPLGLRPFQALYVHVPFCTFKCDYCTFYSVPGAAASQRQAYLRRLASEFAESAPRCTDLATVFVGGGTPSALTLCELRTLLGLIRRSFRLAPGAEFTVECNPESLTPAKIAALAEGGVNRVSLGVQTFVPRHRRTLGRRGSLRGLAGVFARLRSAGIQNLSVDLIYGIPGQSMDDWEQDMRRACGAGIRHLSTYALTFEEGNRLVRRGMVPVDDAIAVRMWHLADTVARAAGLRRYEVSNLARPGHECHHNLDIWYGATYLGCGPAASSYNGELRWTNPASLTDWLVGVPRTEDALPAERRAAEVLAFGLRTVKGWSCTLFRQRTGFDWLDLRGAVIAELVSEGLLKATPETLRPTRRGLLFADAVAERVL